MIMDPFLTSSVILELHVPAFEPIKEYYLPLGFHVVWEREPEGKKGYLVLQMDNNVLCFWAGNDQVYSQDYFKQFPAGLPRGYGVEIVVMVEDVEMFYEQVKEHANVVKPLASRPWGLKDFRTADPAGFYLRFTDRYDILDPRYRVE
jgi:hypothetical protein